MAVLLLSFFILLFLIRPAPSQRLSRRAGGPVVAIAMALALLRGMAALPSIAGLLREGALLLAALLLLLARATDWAETGALTVGIILGPVPVVPALGVRGPAALASMARN
jgi:hypothetical protein